MTTGGDIWDSHTDGGYSLAASSPASPATSLPSRVTHRFTEMAAAQSSMPNKPLSVMEPSRREALGGGNLQGLPGASAYLKANAMKAVSVPPNYQGGRKRFCISMSFLESNCHFCCRYSSIKGHSGLPGSGFLQPSPLPASSIGNSQPATTSCLS